MIQLRKLYPLPAIVAALTVTIAALAAGCGLVEQANYPQGSEVVAIECEIYYRASMDEGFQKSVFTLGPDSSMESAQFDDMAVSVQFLDDPGEGLSLSIVTTERDTMREVARQLYQIDRSRGLADQFIGGHGFTGLQYAFHPSSMAEVQYYCHVD